MDYEPKGLTLANIMFLARPYKALKQAHEDPRKLFEPLGELTKPLGASGSLSDTGSLLIVRLNITKS